MQPGADFADEDSRGRLEDDVGGKEDEVGNVLEEVSHNEPCNLFLLLFFSGLIDANR